MTEVKLAGAYIPGFVKRARPSRNAMTWTTRFESSDVATVVFLATLVVIAVATYNDYSISNDEGVQHHYGELIVKYYTSGFKSQSLQLPKTLSLRWLVRRHAIAIAHLVPIDPYDLRHILCALIGIGGIGTTAATARLIAGPRAGLIAAISLTLCGAWYGSMFNHTEGHSLCRGDDGATLFLIRIAPLPLPRAADVALFGRRECARRTGYWVVAGHLRRFCDRPESATAGAEPWSYAFALRRRNRP